MPFTPPGIPSSWLVIALLFATGCTVRTYQPMSGLHRPAVIDPQAANFQDVSLTVHCVPGPGFSRGSASVLCDKVGRLFENQGATVRTIAAVGRIDDDLSDEASDESESEPTTDLILELRAREIHESQHPMSWLLCIASFTVLPGISEKTFAQDVSIRDSDGFLLVTDSLEGRLLTRFGFGPWLGNKLVDLTRDRENRVSGGAGPRDLSADLYQQLSQLTFNAKMQREVLLQTRSSETTP